MHDTDNVSHTHLRTRVTEVVCGDVSPSNGAPSAISGMAIASSNSISGISRITSSTSHPPPPPPPHGGTAMGVATTAPAKASAAAAVRSAVRHEDSAGAEKELAWVHRSPVVSADDPPPCVERWRSNYGAVSLCTSCIPTTGAMCVAASDTPLGLSLLSDPG